MSTPQPQRPAEAGAHSPLPWKVNDDLWPRKGNIYDANNVIVAEIDDSWTLTSPSNRALIVTAVNERPALLARLAAAEKLAEAAKAIQEHALVMCMHRGLYGDTPAECNRCQAMRQLAAALLAFEATAGTQEGADA